MGGNGSNFLPFLSSKTHPGHARDAFWKLRGAKGGERGLEEGRSLGMPGQAVDQPGRYIHPLPSPLAEFCRNLLKRLNSEKEMKGNERNLPCFTGVSRIQTASERVLENPLCRRQRRNRGTRKRHRNRLKTFISRRKWYGPGSLGPDIWCWGAQAFEKAQNGNGRLLLRVGMDLGLAPLPLGVGATRSRPRRCSSGEFRHDRGELRLHFPAIELLRSPSRGQGGFGAAQRMAGQFGRCGARPRAPRRDRRCNGEPDRARRRRWPLCAPRRGREGPSSTRRRS